MRDNIAEKYTSNVDMCATMCDNIADEHWCNNIAGLKKMAWGIWSNARDTWKC